MRIWALGPFLDDSIIWKECEDIMTSGVLLSFNMSVCCFFQNTEKVFQNVTYSPIEVCC